MKKKLKAIFDNSKRLKIDDKSKLVIMSDCHRGIGNNYDNFLKNKNIFEAALLHYYNNDFTYIELGDGDEMWEVKNCQDIVEVNLSTFRILKKFHEKNRLIMIYGNHDITKKNHEISKKCFYCYEDKITKKREVLLDNLVVYESLVLDYNDNDIFLIHGHQVDFLNSTMWRVSCFVVRYMWRYIENFVAKDPTNSAKNYKVKRRTEKKLKSWSEENNKILIAGHTHKAIFPKAGQGLYFNDGSCVHPNGITCLEITNGKISLVRWSFMVKENGLVYVGKEILEGVEDITSFFK